jgi:hypothetical protein
MGKIIIERKSGKYRVIFIDEYGMSILDETKKITTAKKSLRKFMSDLKRGILLKPTKRVTGWRDYYPRRKLKMVI